MEPLEPLLGLDDHGGGHRDVARWRQPWRAGSQLGPRRRHGAQPEQADTVARELGGLALPADLLRREDLVAALGRLLDEVGRVDILVNAAGGNLAGTTLGEGAPVLDMPQDGVLRGGRPESRRDAAAVPGVRAAMTSGASGNVSSMAADRAITPVVGYAAAKAASFVTGTIVPVDGGFSAFSAA